MMTPAPFRHRAWGLTIASEIALAPFLPPAPDDAAADVAVARRARTDGAPAGLQVGDAASMQRVRLAYATLTIDVCEGCRVTVTDDDNAADEELAQVIAGPMMGAVLTQRGCYVLHASAVRLAGQVIAFTAASGVGKSTLAVLLSACGAEYLADDIVAVQMDARGPRIVLGPRVAKVSDPRLVAGWEVLGREALGGRCVARPLRDGLADGAELTLDRICVIADGRDGEPVRVTALSGASAVVAIAEADFGAALVPPARRHAFLQRARDLAASVRVERVTRPRRLDVGGAVAQALTGTSGERGAVAR